MIRWIVISIVILSGCDDIKDKEFEFNECIIGTMDIDKKEKKYKKYNIEFNVICSKNECEESLFTDEKNIYKVEKEDRRYKGREDDYRKIKLTWSMKTKEAELYLTNDFGYKTEVICKGKIKEV